MKFKNGEISKYTYPAKSLNWPDRGWDFDITHWQALDSEERE